MEQHAEIDLLDDSEPAAGATATPTFKNPSDGTTEWMRLHRSVVNMWRLERGLVNAVITIGLFAGGIPLWLFTPLPGPLVWAIWLIWVCWGSIDTLFWPRWQYDTWRYRLGDRTLELRFGVVWQKSVLIPLKRIQHVDLHRNPLERYMNLASLEFFTAGTRNASHRIPGLAAAAADDFRSDIISASDVESDS